MSALVSIVIANYNYGRFLEEAICSVLEQSCQDFELIVCDAASTDNSLEVIKKYADRISWWCSEPDGGQSAAFNKGFSHAKGRFLTWLNADDVMMPGTLSAFAKAVQKHPECQWFVGGVMWLTKDMRIIEMRRGRPFSNLRLKCGVVSVWGPSSFFSRDLFNSIGGVDERFKYTMDTDLWLRFAVKAGARYRPFCSYAWGLRLHEDAKMSGHNFSHDGKFCANTTAVVARGSAKGRQLALEKAWRDEVCSPRFRLSLFLKLISMSVFKSIISRIDTLVYKGDFYKDYYR